VCLNKITKPPVSRGQGPYKNCRAAGDDDYMSVFSIVGYDLVRF